MSPSRMEQAAIDQTEPRRPLTWALGEPATPKEAAFAYLVSKAVMESLPAAWLVLPTGKPTADTIAARTLRALKEVTNSNKETK